MKHLLVDGMNFAHRARAGFKLGPHPLMFNFYRNLRALVEMHKPDRVYYVLEGHPKARYEALPEYKAQRKIGIDEPGWDEADQFFGDVQDVLKLLMKAFPVKIAKHPDHECDDVIAHLVEVFCDELGVFEPEKTDEVVIASSDSDFIQLLQQYRNVKLYNPMKKTFVEAPEYNYLTWKALRGDGSDNIPGIPGCGDKTAAKLAATCEQDLSQLMKYLQDAPGRLDTYQRNFNLISFPTFQNSDLEGLLIHAGRADWTKVKEVFDSYGFKSITNEKSWEKFVDTFEKASK